MIRGIVAILVLTVLSGGCLAPVHGDRAHLQVSPVAPTPHYLELSELPEDGAARLLVETIRDADGGHRSVAITAATGGQILEAIDAALAEKYDEQAISQTVLWNGTYYAINVIVI